MLYALEYIIAEIVDEYVALIYVNTGDLLKNFVIN